MNISEHTTSFIQEMKRRNYAKNTIENYASNIKAFFAWSTKDHPKNINEKDIKEYLGRFNEVNTQKSHHGAIKLFYEICLGQKEKFKFIPYARPNKKLPIILSKDEIQKLFFVCENLKHRVILGLIYSTGMRVSELINLRWKHIDRSRMIINIIAGKGAKDRQVMLAPNIIPLLEKYWYEYKTKDFVIAGQFSEQYTASSVNQMIKQLAEKAKINKRVYTHLMRHCTFTHLVEAGIDINRIKDLAGHENVKTTMGYLQISSNLIAAMPSPINSIAI